MREVDIDRDGAENAEAMRPASRVEPLVNMTMWKRKFSRVNK